MPKVLELQEGNKITQIFMTYAKRKMVAKSKLDTNYPMHCYQYRAFLDLHAYHWQWKSGEKFNMRQYSLR